MINPPQPPIDLEEFARTVGATANSRPRTLFSLDDNLSYHAGRLLLLIRYAGRPKTTAPSIVGRTKLAKLDFFVRYPTFLIKAAEIAGDSDFGVRVRKALEPHSTESQMVRYRYGPWDHRYYLVLGLMSGKKLISIETKNGVDHYKLHTNGLEAVESLGANNSWREIILRCELVGELFGDRNGSYLKDFIYRHFPEVVHTQFTNLIEAEQNS